MNDWPHNAIHTVAIWNIQKNIMHEADWQYTRLHPTHEPMFFADELEPNERPIVSCHINEQSWFVMTTSRVVANNRGQRFEVSPLAIKDWDWGDFKNEAPPKVGVAKLLLPDGRSKKMSYETVYAAMAPINYEKFWRLKYPILDKLDVNRIAAKLGTSKIT